ncbi:MAG: hypothetical protein WED00_00670 [Aquisalimonadaceae bacterium]
MPAKQLDTSITDTRPRQFLAQADERDTLWCDRITGFHLIKLMKRDEGDDASTTGRQLAFIALGQASIRMDTCEGQLLMGFYETLGRYIAGDPIHR